MATKRSRQAFEADLQKQNSPFVFYGTPLPSLDEHTQDDGSFVPVWKQEVLDERGRKRLHGAFTGGFSAGYFNSVGSKEGWAPATFVSSRQNRAKDNQKASQQRPEDFMDEEDVREAEESHTVNATEDYSGFGTAQDTMRKTALVDIFRPSGETIGSKLLQRMGWREGIGIGARVRRAANLGDEDGSDSAEIHSFAPDDVQVVSFVRKTDYKGLGYEGELQDQLGITSSTSRPIQERPNEDELSDEGDSMPLLALNPQSVARRKKTGFGVGVLNDDGSDDEDPYSMGPRISYNKTVGGNQKSKRSKIPATSANPLLKTKPTFISKKLASLKGALRKCHDGRLPLDGFVLEDQLDSLGTMTLEDERFRPPDVPEGWNSAKLSDTESKTNSEFLSTSEAAKASNLTAKSRASLLGESQLPGKSVFDFLTPAARDRVATATGRQNLPAAGGEVGSISFTTTKSTSETLQDLVPKLDRESAIQALSRGKGGWMPYAEDETKRARYQTYLEIQAGLRSDDELPPRADHMRQDDWVLEMHEFARAAEVFKPISGLMASRFTSSSSTPQGQDGKAADASVDALLSRPSAKPENPADAAAKMGMFGPMTRSVANFYPTRLLCKRFGAAMPTHSASDGDTAGNSYTATPAAAESSAAQFRSFASAGFDTDVPSEAGKTKGPSLMIQQTNETAGKDVNLSDPDKNEALEQERPSHAIFNAIFGSDDESD